MTWSLLIVQYPLCWLVVIAIIGLCIGSFLNVVIYRLPIILRHAWQQELQALNGDSATLPILDQPYNLWMPRSACPHCHILIKTWDNIPLLSWLLLRGRCRHCQRPISSRYPLIELTCALVSLLLALLFPFGLSLLGVLLFSWFLLALAVIDLDTWQLPDQLTLPLLWLGLLFNLQGEYVDLPDAVLGAIAGYLVLWLLYWGFKLTTGREGMGYGDFKLLAALGAWVGWATLPELLIIAALLGIAMALYNRWQSGLSLHNPIPFGPALALSGWICMLYWHAG